MSASTGFWPITGHLKAVACFPVIPSFACECLVDGCGNLYAKIAETGDLILGRPRVSSNVDPGRASSVRQCAPQQRS